MANIGTLMARIGIDTKALSVGLARAKGMLGNFGGAVTGLLGPVGTLAAGAGGFYGMAKGLQAISAATQVAARIEVMNHVLIMTGKNAGYSESELKGYRNTIMGLGIAEKEAIQIEQLFIQSKLKVADATKIARAAQDLAVISGQNSSEAAQTLTQAIVAQRPILLKQFGIIASLDKIYNEMAQTLGKARSQLTETEKRQGFVNEILKQASTVAGSYETAMRDVGKQMTSLPRYFQDAQKAIGQYFLPAMQGIVTTTGDVLKSIRKLLETTESATERFFAARKAFESKAEATNRLADRYDELTAKTTLNRVEQSELQRIMNQLIAIMPTAISQWDDASTAIALNTDKIRANIDSQRGLFRVQQAGVIEDWKDEYTKLSETLKLNQAVIDNQADTFANFDAALDSGSMTLVEYNKATAFFNNNLKTSEGVLVLTHNRMRDLLIALGQGYDAVNDFARAEAYLGTELARTLKALQESEQAVSDLGKSTETAIERLRTALGPLPTPAVEDFPIMALPDPVTLKQQYGGILEIIDEFNEHQAKSAAMGLATIEDQYDLHAEWLESWAGQVSGAMSAAFEDFFFDAITGKLKSLHDYLTAFMNSIARIVSQKLATSFVEKLIPGFQHGGIVRQPTLAMVGERGPEAIIPLDRLEGAGMPSREERPINVIVNVNTPDVGSFRTSQTQIATQMAAALTAARRNM